MRAPFGLRFISAAALLRFLQGETATASMFGRAARRSCCELAVAPAVNFSGKTTLFIRSVAASSACDLDNNNRGRMSGNVWLAELLRFTRLTVLTASKAPCQAVSWLPKLSRRAERAI